MLHYANIYSQECFAGTLKLARTQFPLYPIPDSWMLADKFPHNIEDEEKQQQTSNFWDMQFPSATFYKDKCQWKTHLFLLHHKIWNISNEIQDSLKDRFSADAVYLHGNFIMAFRSPDSYNVTLKISLLCATSLWRHVPLTRESKPQFLC